MTERLHFHFSLECIGEGNGNPLQCPCLENPRDGGAWWAAVYGVAQSRTQLKRPSSSSSIRGLCSLYLPQVLALVKSLQIFTYVFVWKCFHFSWVNSIAKIGKSVDLYLIPLVILRVQSIQSYLTLFDPMDCSPPGSPDHGILQAKIQNGLPFPSLGDLPEPGIEPESLMSPALAGGFFITRATLEAPQSLNNY